MRDFKEFLKQQDEGLGKFIMNLGRRKDYTNEPWNAPGAIPPKYEGGWRYIIMNSGMTGMKAWDQFQQLLQTPAGKAWLIRVGSGMQAPGELPPMPKGDGTHPSMGHPQQTSSDFFKGNYGPGGPMPVGR